MYRVHCLRLNINKFEDSYYVYLSGTLAQSGFGKIVKIRDFGIDVRKRSIFHFQCDWNIKIQLVYNYFRKWYLWKNLRSFFWTMTKTFPNFHDVIDGHVRAPGIENRDRSLELLTHIVKKKGFHHSLQNFPGTSCSSKANRIEPGNSQPKRVYDRA